jgi:hypothetical protein
MQPVSAGSLSPQTLPVAHDLLGPEWALVWVTLALCLITGALAAFTAKLYLATVKLSADADRVGHEQGTRMEKSISETARSASAIEDLALATKKNAELMYGTLAKQMRAYVSVKTGTAIYQDETLRFQYDPVISNSGLTPAYNISYKISTDVLPTDLPPDHEFVFYGQARENDAFLAPRESFFLSGVLRHRFPDAEVEEIMHGEGRRLFCWGEVTYDDIYGASWKTRFCHTVSFYRYGSGPKDARVTIQYHPTHNNAT